MAEELRSLYLIAGTDGAKIDATRARLRARAESEGGSGSLEVFEAGRLVGIPLTMEINDLPHAMRYGRSPRQFVEAFDDQLDYALGTESEALIIDVTAHAHVYGRPAGAAAFEAIARKACTRDDVWIATRGEIARHVLNGL